MEILAKKKELEDGSIVTQSLQEHTDWVLQEAFKLIDDKSLANVSKISGFKKDKILDLIFFSCYFHDIGKATKQFHQTLQYNKKSFHSLYAISALSHIKNFSIYGKYNTDVNLLAILCLTHHTLLRYKFNNTKFEFLDGAEKVFKNYTNSYKKYFNKKCDYNFSFEVDKDIETIILDINEALKYTKKNKIRILYSYCSGILNLADWLASARFNNSLPKTFFYSIPTKANFMSKLSFNTLRTFQKELSQSKKTVLVEIPTGEGKTEGSLLWAIKNLHDKNTKIIYTLPTQVTSNKLYERICKLFDKDECGLIHSFSKFYLEKEYEKEHGLVDNFFKSEVTFNKNFSKPITVSTIDSLLKFFINIGRFNIATKNFLNSVIIIDEIHCYDFKLLGFIKRFLELCEEFDIKVCIMSASIPKKIKQELNITKYTPITEPNLFAKKANEITKIDENLDKKFNLIDEKFKQNKNILVIRNTVKSATQTYKTLIKKFDIDKTDVILYHSCFKKRDKTFKENEIFEKLENKKPFILVATQIVEISLDIDFDVMFTDNAPIDALIQRFGRVNRKKDIIKKGEIYIFAYNEKYPYESQYLLQTTFKTIKNGYFELSEYTNWLNEVYDKVFETDIQTKNELEKFNEGYEKYDKTLKELNGIFKSEDNYDLRDIKVQKIDYLLYDDFMNDNIGSKNYYEYTISLPNYFTQQYLYHTQLECFYKVLNIPYSYEIGLELEKEHQGLLQLGE